MTASNVNWQINVDETIPMTSENSDSKHTSETKSASQNQACNTRTTNEATQYKASTKARDWPRKIGGPVISSSEEDQARPVWSGPAQKMDSNIASHQAIFLRNESSFI